MIEALRRGAASTDGDDGVVRVSSTSLLALLRGTPALALKPLQAHALGGGGRRSPFKGRGMEFDEARPYVHGDDVRSIDWRVTARSGKPHTKLFREERERPVLLWLDLRAAMFFATRGAFKSVRAAQAAALLGWSALHRGDRLGALIFDERHHVELRPRRGQSSFLHLLRRLVDHPAWQPPHVHEEQGAAVAAHQALLRLRRVAQPGSLITLLSDFSGLGPRDLPHLARLARHNDVVLAHFHDPLEEDLPPAGRYRVSDGRRFLSLETGNRALRERYRRRSADRRIELQQFCRRTGITLLALGTGDVPLAALQRGLGAAL